MPGFHRPSVGLISVNNFFKQHLLNHLVEWISQNFTGMILGGPLQNYSNTPIPCRILVAMAADFPPKNLLVKNY